MLYCLEISPGCLMDNPPRPAPDNAAPAPAPAPALCPLARFLRCKDRVGRSFVWRHRDQGRVRCPYHQAATLNK